MLQIIQAIMKDPKDETVCYLLFANQVSQSFFFHSVCVYIVLVYITFIYVKKM